MRTTIAAGITQRQFICSQFCTVVRFSTNGLELMGVELPFTEERPLCWGDGIEPGLPVADALELLPALD